MLNPYFEINLKKKLICILSYLRFSAVQDLIDSHNGDQAEQHDGSEDSQPGRKGERRVEANCFIIPKIQII